MKVSVFGGSQARVGSDAYNDAIRLGELLARAGHTVLTGGYMGTMEAVSRGAASGGGHVIGVTCDEIGRWHGRDANVWVAEEWKRRTLMERLDALIRGGDAALALPGGPGTLAEITLMWDLMIVGSLNPRPLVLVGNAWKAVFDSFEAEFGGYTPASHRRLLHFAMGSADAVRMVQDLLPGTREDKSS